MTSLHKKEIKNKKVKRTPALVLSLLLFIFVNMFSFLMTPGEVNAQQAKETVPRPKVLMILLNRISVDDITGGAYKNINRLLSIGSIGLMTVNTAGGYTDVNAYVTMGGGDRLLGDQRVGETFNRAERLSDGATGLDIYRRNMGIMPESAHILSTGVPSVIDANKEEYTFSLPGKLGTLLHQQDLKTALVGNSDLGPVDHPNRIAAAVVMDSLGRIDYGDVSKELLKKDTMYPYGWRTDYDHLVSTVNQVWDKSDFIVVETGDSIRANANSSQQFKKMKEIHRKNAIKQADAFIGEIIPKVSKNLLVMLVTPLPQDDFLREGIRLTPVIMAGGYIEKAGVLISPSTRRTGLITNYDISVTVLRHLGVANTNGLMGLPVSGIKPVSHSNTRLAASLNEDESVPTNLSIISKLYVLLNTNSKLRSLVLFYYTRFHWGIFGAILLLIVFDRLRKTPISSIEKSVMKTILFLPLIILLTAGLPISNVYFNLSVILAAAMTTLYLCGKNKNDYVVYMIVALFNVGISVGDVIFGGFLMKKAALSYDMVAGGRFYGIGNEYMGVVLGAAILGFSAWLQHKPGLKNKIIIAASVSFCLLVLFFAAPFAGTNAGGTLAAIVGFVTVVYFFLGKKITLRTFAVATGTMAAGLGTLITMNFVATVKTSSHIGRSIDFLMMGNVDMIWQTIMRKLEANLYLLRNSPFSVVLIMQLLILIAIVLKENKRLLDWGKKEYYLFTGFIGIFLGSLAAFAFNDSGVIASAMMNNYLVIPLLLKLRGNVADSLNEGSA